MRGKNAPTPPEQSVAGMRKAIAGLTLADGGKFLRWNGGERAW